MASRDARRRSAGLVLPFVERFAHIVLARPGVTLATVLALCVVAIFVASHLTFDTRFSALLPDDTPELVEVNELQEKAGGTMELIVAVGGGDHARKLRFARAVVKQLKTKPWIRRADAEFPVDFFLDRRLLLLSVKALRDLHEAIETEIERAKARANPLYVDLEGEGGPKPWAEVDERRTLSRGDLLKRTYTTPDGKYLFIRVIPMGTSYNMAAGKKVLSDIKATVAAAGPKRHGVHVRYAGGLELNQEQHARMMTDLKRASIIALALILLLMTIHVRRLSAPFVLVVPLVTGVTTTLAITAVTIGQLNLVSGFLVSALFGLGIDFEIHLYLRYLEKLERSRDRLAAMHQAILKTMPACLTAAATTAAAFFAMAISDFRGYREYGLIAGMGVLVTLVVTFIALPPLALLIDRRGRPHRPTGRLRVLSRRLAWPMVALGTVLFILALWVAPKVRWYNDFSKLRGISDKVEFSRYVGDQIGGDFSPAAIYVENLAQARQVEAHLKPLAANPTSWVKHYLSLATLVPSELERKRPILREIERNLREVLETGKLKPDDRKRVEDALKLARVRPWRVKDIPKVFRDQFQTVDNKGQFVIVWPRYHTDVDRDVVAWAGVLERIRHGLRDRGIPAKVIEENRIAARVLVQMRADAPSVLTAAGVAVLLFLILDFRTPRLVTMVAGTLGVGIAWMLGMMYLWNIDINVFNQAVLATIIGVGIDNAVHIQHRYIEEGPGSITKVVSTTGSAAFLASATTAIGFGAAVTAHHMGIRSLGWLSIIGLTCTFVASTIYFPAVLRLLEGRRGREKA